MKTLSKLFKIFLAGGLMAAGYWLFVIFPVSAADPKFELEYPGLGPLVVPADKFIEWFFSFALGSAGVLAFGVLVFGGIKYIASAGNSSGQQDAKQWIQGAILGLILLLGSVLILSTINPDLTKLGVPPDPSFEFGGQRIIEPSTYLGCMEKFSAANCGCGDANLNLGTPEETGELWENLSCPGYPYDSPMGPVIQHWCRIDQVCVEQTMLFTTGRYQKYIWCCFKPL